ncbi:hypothetical protein CXB51_016289 [Gossypium anomalum]|uniref:Integrase catalytic domain-containing protein n=1 Tax=Gossypium anomalum TaxID=47600 RepID=A0A8J5YFT7_9ROSI|nr:hypothetical protein CXB51_016289 [Gossypium anomalum]
MNGMKRLTGRKSDLAMVVIEIGSFYMIENFGWFYHGISRLASGGCFRSVCMDLTIESPTGAAAHASFSNPRLIHSFSRHDTVKLDGTNFVQWQFQVRLIVEGYDLQGFLDSSIPVPPKVVTMSDGTLAPNPEAVLFTQQDKLLASWLLSTVNSSLLSYFISTKTACDIWSAVSHLFAASSIEKVAQIRHDLHAVQKGGSTVKEYVSKIKTLCALLEASGSVVSEAEKVEVLLGGLPPKFDSVFILVSVSSESLTFQKLVDVLMAFENRQTRAVRDVPMVAHVVETPAVAAFDSRGICGWRSMARARGGRGFCMRVQCQICHRLGHVAQRCYYRFDRDYGGSNVAVVAGGGAPNWAGLSAPRVYAPRPYAHPSRPVMRLGPMHILAGLLWYVPQQSPGSPVANFMGVPAALLEAPWHTKPRARVFDVDNSQNISLPRILDFCAFDFLDSSQFDSSYVPTQVGFSSWYLDSEESHHYSQESVICVSVAKVNSVFFEFHPSYCVIKDIQTQEILLRGQVRDGLYHFSVASPGSSTRWLRFIILKGNSHKLPFSSSSTEYVELFELVISDLWGPASKLIATQFGRHIKKFQSDWGGEFRVFASVLAQQGILHRLSCHHTSKQNGVAEQKHQHIVQTGLTLLAQANLPMKHWGYAFSSVVHFINRLLTSVLQGQSPYQKLYGCVPQYSHLRVFGCCCFPYLLPFVCHKLDFRSQPCKFLGYSSQHKGYLCLTPEGRVIVSHHVVFDEHRFLFLSPLSDSGNPSRQTATYIPSLLLVVSTPSPVSDFACEAVNPGFDSSFDTSVLPVDVIVSPGTAVSGDLRDSGPAPLLSFEFLILVQIPCASSGNTYAIVTRSEAGVFKLKVLTVEAVDFEPSFIDETLAHLDWKRNPDGSVSHRKAHLVAKECSQVDVNNAFLNRELDNEAPKAWFDKLKQFLVAIGFVPSKSDASLFIRITPEFVLYVLVYVDNIIITGSDSAVIASFVDQLNVEFALKDMGDLHYFLGIEKKYVRDLLARSSFSNAKPVHTPMISLPRLSKSDGDLLSDPTEYQSLTGALQYVVLTRPNIAYAVNRICQFMHSPTTVHMVALKRILRYLCGTLDYGVVFRPSTRLSLVGYADANWGLDFDDRRSTSGYYVYLVIHQSRAEVEYRSIAAATSDVTWLLSLLQELQVLSIDTLTIWSDSSSAVAVAANLVLHSKFKHVELDLFFVHEKVAAGTIVVGEVPASD